MRYQTAKGSHAIRWKRRKWTVMRRKSSTYFVVVVFSMLYPRTDKEVSEFPKEFSQFAFTSSFCLSFSFLDFVELAYFTWKKFLETYVARKAVKKKSVIFDQERDL